jgi:hypothetical protein
MRRAVLAGVAAGVLAVTAVAGPKEDSWRANALLQDGYDSEPLSGNVLWFIDLFGIDRKSEQTWRRSRSPEAPNPLVPAPGRTSVVAPPIAAPQAPVLSVRNDGGAGSYSVLALPFDLHPPFRWEVTAGAVTPGGPGPGAGFFCTELDTRGSSPLDFFALCAQASGDGFQVWVARAGENLIGLTTIPSASALDLAVAHDGDAMTFFARPTGAETFQEITAFPHDPYAALFPAIGASGLPSGAQVDFAAFRAVENGPSPEGTPTEALFARTFAEPAATLVSAFFSLSGPPLAAPVTDDLAAVAVDLGEAAAELKAAAPDLDDPTAALRAAKSAKAAGKLAAKAAKLAVKEKPIPSVGKVAWKAVQTVVRAVQEIDPHSLENP